MTDLVYDLRQMTGMDHVGVTAHRAANEIERLRAIEHAAIAYAETVEVLTNGPKDRVRWAMKAQPECIRALHALVQKKLKS